MPDPDARVPWREKRGWEVLVVSNDLKAASGSEREIRHRLRREDRCDHHMGVGRVVTPLPISTIQRVHGDTWRVPRWWPHVRVRAAGTRACPATMPRGGVQ